MMPKYHIGSLDRTSRRMLRESEVAGDASSEPRDIFLQSRTWTKAILSGKKIISGDTRIFRFDLEHKEQRIGLPVGQHLMMRLRDPVTHEFIIRSYTPISEGTDKGKLDVLVKVYFDSAERKGGKMTKALDVIPLGYPVDFRGPVGKFEYLGKGRCTIGGKERHVRKLIMICGGSGITPIFQVLRAILQDDQDLTRCLVLDGNRLEEDILCREEMQELIKGREHKCHLLHTLTKASENWSGLRGRIGMELLEKEVGKYGSFGLKPREELVLICGPETLEKSVHKLLGELGWKDEDILFF